MQHFICFPFHFSFVWKKNETITSSNIKLFTNIFVYIFPGATTWQRKSQNRFNRKTKSRRWWTDKGLKKGKYNFSMNIKHAILVSSENISSCVFFSPSFIYIATLRWLSMCLKHRNITKHEKEVGYFHFMYVFYVTIYVFALLYYMYVDVFQRIILSTYYVYEWKWMRYIYVYDMMLYDVR